MTARKSQITAGWLILTGFGLFIFNIILADNGYASIFGTWLSLPVVTWIQMSGLCIVLTGLTILAASNARRNKWLAVVGMLGAMTSFAAFILFVAIPVFDIALGYHGTTTFDSLGFWVERWLVMLLIPSIGLATAQVLIWSAQMLLGRTRFQR